MGGLILTAIAKEKKSPRREIKCLYHTIVSTEHKLSLYGAHLVKMDQKNNAWHRDDKSWAQDG